MIGLCSFMFALCVRFFSLAMAWSSLLFYHHRGRHFSAVFVLCLNIFYVFQSSCCAMRMTHQQHVLDWAGLHDDPDSLQKVNCCAIRSMQQHQADQKTAILCWPPGSEPLTNEQRHDNSCKCRLALPALCFFSHVDPLHSSHCTPPRLSHFCLCAELSRSECSACAPPTCFHLAFFALSHPHCNLHLSVVS